MIRNGFQADASDPSSSGPGDWEQLTMIEPPRRNQIGGNGFYLLSFDRPCLPEIGRAAFGLHFGRIDGRITGVAADSMQATVDGGAWNNSLQRIDAPDLGGFEIRIQKASQTADDWRTVWWGTCETHSDAGWPGADIPAGDRVYSCADALFRLTRAQLDRHGYASSEGGSLVTIGNLRGHPGYNTAVGREGRTAGNLLMGGSTWTPDAATSGSAYPISAYYHTWAGASSTIQRPWTDLEALQHALATTRRKGDPLFIISGSGAALDRLGGASAWAVADGDTCMSLLTRILKRERGRGLAYLSWVDDVANPEGPIQARITVSPQNPLDINYTDPVTGSTVTIVGSYTTGTNASPVNLIGDHRNVAELYRLGDKAQFKLDALETVGEAIEVLSSLCVQDGQTGAAPNLSGRSLIRRFTDADQTAFRALTTAKQRISERWKNVYQVYGPPLSWDFYVADGNGAASVPLSRCDYRCAGEDDYAGIVTPHGTAILNGGILVPDQVGLNGVVEKTSPLLYTLLDDIPIYDGWDYRTATPVRWDAQEQVSAPSRKPLLAFMRTAANQYYTFDELSALTGSGLTVRVDGQQLWIYNQADAGTGLRMVGDTTLANLGPSSFDYNQIVVTVGIRLPHRVRFYSGLPLDNKDCKRKSTIYQPNHHLWLAHPGAIWDVDATTGDLGATGHTPRRKAAAGTSDMPGILRDDRSALAYLHYLTWDWYSTERRTAQWGLRCFGVGGTFEAFQGSAVPTNGTEPSGYNYPTLGQVVTDMFANGETHHLNTPITKVSYNNQQGITTWVTEWQNLDYHSQATYDYAA